MSARAEPPKWHPIMTAQERPTGTWRMMDEHGQVYGVVYLRRRNSEITYRAEYRGELIGWANPLELATYGCS